MKTVLRVLFVTGLLVSMAVAQSPWTLQTSPTTQRLRVMRPVSAQVVWACGNAGAVVRTVNGGTTWQLKTAPDATFNMYGLDAIDSLTAWVMGTAASVGVTGDSRIWKTTNGGATWTEQLKIADTWADGVRFLDANNGVAVGDPGAATKSKMTIFTTTNGGTNWTLVPGAGNPSVDSVADEVGITNGVDVTGTTLWFITYGNTDAIQPRVFKSTDKGLTWTASPKIAIDNSYGFSMKDATTGITCNINSGSIAKSTNGWATADSMLVFGGVYGLRAIDWIPGTNSIVIVGGPSSTGFSGLSKDGGKTWTPQTLPTGIARLYTVQFANTSTGWASDNVGKILKWTGGDLAPVQTQVLLNDDFKSPAGTVLTSAGWTLSGTTTTSPLTIATPGLTFTGLPGSGVGAAVPMANTGQDVYKGFNPVSSGSVYLSFLMNVSAALTGDYFIALSPSTLQTNYYARLHVKSNGAGYSFGINKSNEVTGGAQYGTTVFNFNTTYFVTVKYTFTGAATDTTSNDPISVYVLPSGSSLATEPATGEINGYLTNGKLDATDLGFVTLRQGSNTAAPTLVLDAVRVGNTWASATAAAPPDSANVTFWANTSTVPDTLKSNSFVQIRGSKNAIGPWGTQPGAGTMSFVAGDYWKQTLKFQVGDTVQFKFFTNAKNPLPSPAGDQPGWENNSTDASGNRILIVGPKDTTLPVQFVNGTPINQAQYYTPYVDQKDSVEVWFRINMAGNPNFSKNSQFMGVRGGTAPLDWGKSILLKKESQHGNGGSQQYDGTNFWSGYARFPKSAFASTISYKYVILGSNSPTADVTAWEDGTKPAFDVGGDGNRNIIASPGISDTTIAWKWWANAAFVPFTGSDTVIVTFRVNMQRAVSERGFAFGDTLQVRSGYGGTGATEGKTKKLERSGLTGTTFIATDTVVAAVGKLLHYQYYLVKGGIDVREIFYDFDWTGDIAQSERRKASVTSKLLSLFDTASSSIDLHRMPRFRNTSKLTKPVNVTWTVDVRPAIYTVKAGKKLVSTNITPYVIGNVDSIKIWGVWMNGPAVGGWDTRGAWGPARRADSLSKMYDDGTHGDLVKGDSVYSLKWRYTTDDFVGQEFKFGIGGLDNEGGFGNNHIENVSDADTVFTIASQFGSIDPKFYNSWDFDLKKPKLATAVEDNWSVPMIYELSQNYPNPFNPSTTIRFTIPTQDVVTLKVFNVLGQEMMTILNQKMDAGKHTVRFDASKLTSGVYLYQVSAGKFVETKKMVLLK